MHSSRAVVVATGIGVDGSREMLGIPLTNSPQYASHEDELRDAEETIESNDPSALLVRCQIFLWAELATSIPGSGKIAVPCSLERYFEHECPFVDRH
ncbi:MAG: hypothetical protein JWM55_1324 [Acidimicrobiaceae bacterium]|nr:hypothetical protein [Acidimicrobiaceae bacterium]